MNHKHHSGIFLPKMFHCPRFFKRIFVVVYGIHISRSAPTALTVVFQKSYRQRRQNGQARQCFMRAERELCFASPPSVRFPVHIGRHCTLWIKQFLRLFPPKYWKWVILCVIYMSWSRFKTKLRPWHACIKALHVQIIITSRALRNLVAKLVSR